jgi:hypothetical protein
MAVLGSNGRVILNRSAPTPVVVEVTDLNQDKNIVLLSAPSFRTGDLVEVASIDNWPNDYLFDSRLVPTYANTYQHQDWAEAVDYSVAYPSSLLRPFRWLSTEENEPLTTQDGDALVIEPAAADQQPYRNQLYVHVDQLNRLSFYRTRAAALAGASGATRENIDFDDFLPIADAVKIDQGAGLSAYANAQCIMHVIESCSYELADIVGTSGSLSEYGPDYDDASLDAGASSYDNANITPRTEITEVQLSDPLPDTLIELRLVNEWNLECSLQSWELSLNGNEIDTTGLGDQFFDGVKSLIQGGGSLDFLVERESVDTRTTAIVNRDDYANARCFVGVEENLTYNSADIIGTSGSLADYGPDYDDASLDAGTNPYDNANITPRSEIGELADQVLASVGTSNLLRLLLNTAEQAEATAEFWMIDPSQRDRVSYTYTLLPGDLYYRAQILITNTAISTRATEVISGSANFVTVRDVELLEGAA